MKASVLLFSNEPLTRRKWPGTATSRGRVSLLSHGTKDLYLRVYMLKMALSWITSRRVNSDDGAPGSSFLPRTMAAVRTVKTFARGRVTRSGDDSSTRVVSDDTRPSADFTWKPR